MITDVVYLEDEAKFLFKKSGSRLPRDKAAKKILTEFPGAFLRHSDLEEWLDKVKSQLSTTSKAVKREKAEATSINWMQVYDELAPNLPIVYAITNTATKHIFTIKPNNEVSRISFKRNEDIVNALQYDVEVWKALKNFYLASPHFEGHHHKMHFHDFVKTIAYNYLMLDETKQINPTAVKRISWEANEYAYKKFDPSQIKHGPTPTWDEFTSRLDYPEVFKAWVWSVIEPYNNIRQALWLHGGGDDGKSVVQKALSSLLGSQYVKSMQAGELNNQFFLSSVYGKTLVTYADTEEIHIFNNPRIKQITGGDSTSIEFKGQDSFTGDVYSKLFITSNKNPKINPESRAQVSRLIRLQVSKPKTQDKGFQARLESEIWHFLAQCNDAYQKHINEGCNKLLLPPELEKKIIDLCASEGYALMMDFTQNNLEFGDTEEHYCPISEFKRAAREFASEQHLDASQIKYFLQDVEERLQQLGMVAGSKRTIDKKITTVYEGFKLKETK